MPSPFSLFYRAATPRDLHSFPTRRSSDLRRPPTPPPNARRGASSAARWTPEIGEHTSELQSLAYLVCRLLLEKKKPLTAARCSCASGSCASVPQASSAVPT